METEPTGAQYAASCRAVEELWERGINFRALTLPIFAQNGGTKAVKVKQSAISMLLCDFMWAEDIHQKRLCKSFYFSAASMSKEKNTPVFPE